jgi:hypothetical protein
MCIGPYTEVDCNLTLYRLQHMSHGQPYVRADLNPMQEPTLSPSQGLRIWSHLCGAEHCTLYIYTTFSPFESSIRISVSLTRDNFSARLV